ncbi:MAG TPA: mechanosensitive ion channel domain-containing protein [Candidatus Sulfotelmatobacter sp.]|nr:mechanosensitive ion channel domain-containing protein [Candidatus Sulfotelmatobacter sp.]
MVSFRKISIVCILFVAPCTFSGAQSTLTQALQPAPTSGSIVVIDPLGRNTPSNSVLGFLKAATAEDYNIAAQYLQMSAARRQSEGEQTATRLKYVLDKAFVGNYSRFNTPEAIPQEGAALGHQKLGTMSAGDVEADLDLVRVSDPSAGKIWLISTDTLAKLPELYDQVKARQVESKLPVVLVRHQLGGMPLWQWLALLVATPLAAGLGWLILFVMEIPLRWWARRRGRLDVANWRSVSGPAWLLAGTLIHQVFVVYLRMPLLLRHYYFQITSTALILSAIWIVWRVVRWSLYRVRLRALAHGLAGTGSLMLLGERILKAVIFVLGVLAVLGNLGFNMSTALAGLGIGGLAIGFGAQKTIENLFGGVSVLADEVFRVGDVCRFGDRTGVVEDIGLRSTRIRTDERTLLAIPNGTVATINLENLSRRDKILFKTNLNLRSETKADHLRFILSEVRRLLYSHPKVESNTVRVRLIDVAGGAPTVEIMAYVLTQDFNEFAAVREDVLLRIMDIVDSSGSGLALPAQTLYLGRDAGLAKDKAESAVQKIAELRDDKKLPFPDFHKEEISSFKGSIDYPPKESTLRKSEDGSGKTH